MTKFDVRIPFTGELQFEVEADSKEESIEKANSYDLEWKVTDTAKEQSLPDEIKGVEYLDFQVEPISQIVRGNVFYGMTNKAYAEAIDDDEE